MKLCGLWQLPPKNSLPYARPASAVYPATGTRSGNLAHCFNSGSYERDGRRPEAASNYRTWAINPLNGMNRVGDTLVHFAANEDLVRRLLDAQVEFVVIGSLAMAWHCPTRQADDMDLLVDPTEENSTRIATVLDELGLEGPPDAFVSLGRQVTLKELHYAELLTPEKDGPQFAEISSAAVHGKLFGMPVKIASVQSLLALKKRALDAANAQRAKHLADMDLLKNAV